MCLGHAPNVGKHLGKPREVTSGLLRGDTQVGLTKTEEPEVGSLCSRGQQLRSPPLLRTQAHLGEGEGSQVQTIFLL